MRFLTSATRSSTSHQYESVWSSFVACVRLVDPVSISENFVLQYLIYLHRVKRLKPNTIISYKASLSLVVDLRFVIDMRSHAFEMLIRSFKLRDPAVLPKPIQWSLGKVLDYISDLPLPLSFLNLSRKTAFLLALASGNRISGLMLFPEHLRTSPSTLMVQ